MSGDDNDAPGYYPPGTPPERGAWQPPASGPSGWGGWPPVSGAPPVSGGQPVSGPGGGWQPGAGGGGWPHPGADQGSWPPVSGSGWPPVSGGGWPPAGGAQGAGPAGWPPAGGYWPPPPPPPRRSRAGLFIGLFMVLALLVTAVAVGVGIGIGRVREQATAQTGDTSAPSVQAVPGSAAGFPDAAGTAAKVNRVVVDVNTVLGYQNAQAAGTGVIIGSSGLVLTNNHVVAGATSVTVTRVTDGRRYQASVVGYDRTEDIAVVRMNGAAGLPTAAIGDATKAKPGDPVLAIGNAGGTGGTPSVAPGTVSALNRSITASDQSSGSSEQLTGLIEVAANIQSGDSGGPLVNSAGQVIGINTAASVGFRYQEASGTGFAIPINQAMSIGRQIIAGRASAKVHIGATAFIGVQIGSGNGAVTGAPVVGVLSGTPAESAGLVQGDVITSVDGETVDSPNALTEILDGHHPGDRLRVQWVDSQGQRHSATIRPISGPVG